MFGGMAIFLGYRLFLNVPQAPLYAALAAALGISAYFCLVRR